LRNEMPLLTFCAGRLRCIPPFSNSPLSPNHPPAHLNRQELHHWSLGWQK
jgi:hypothetical protein